MLAGKMDERDVDAIFSNLNEYVIVSVMRDSIEGKFAMSICCP
jgi:hypothetical protein